MTYLPMPIVTIRNDGQAEKTAAANHLEYYYNEMKRDGTLQYAFYDGSAHDFERFLQIAFSDKVLFLLIYDKDNIHIPVAHVHLTDFMGYSAMVHFNILRQHHKNALLIGKDGVTFLFDLKRPDATPLVKCLVGITPHSNRAAVAFVLRLGFKRLGYFDDACYLMYRKKYNNGILTKAVNNG